MNQNGLNNNVNNIDVGDKLTNAKILNYGEVFINNSHKLVIKRIANYGDLFVDLRIWIKWSQDQQFHPTDKGIFIRAEIFLRDVLPALIQMFPECLPQLQPQLNASNSQVTVGERAA